ncbi:MAG: hypothetical protein M3P98_01575 [bacterium]|nr:hypothetical protein [bacterium]
MASETEIGILVTLKDQASAAMGKMSGTIEKMQPAFKTMAVAGTVAFGAISAVAMKGIADYAEAEKAALQLRHAVINVSRATEAQLKATEDLADALEKKGVLDGDNIKMGLAQLSTFGLSNKAVQALGGSLSDLAVNQFGVKASGEQLADTANVIAKALNGQFGVLEKSGIRFTEAQRKAIEFGTEMEKVSAINEGFAQNLKYTNEVALKGLEGQLAKTQVSVGNLSESIGKSLEPVLRNIITAVKPVIDSFVEWSTNNPELLLNIILIGGAVAALVAVLGTIGLVLPMVIAGVGMLSTAFMFLTGPIGLVILAIAALVAVGIYLYTHWEEVKISLIEIWDAIKAKAMAIFNSIKEFFKQHWDEMLAIAIPGLGAIIAYVIKNWDEMKANFTGMIKKMSDAWYYMWHGMGEVVKSIWEGVKNTIKSSINWVLEKINSVITAVNSAMSSVSGKLGFGAINIPTIPLLAKGGIVNSPTLAVIGEAGPEAVIPLSRMGSMGQGGGTTVVINMENVMTGPEYAEQMGEVLAMAIKRQIRIA